MLAYSPLLYITAVTTNGTSGVTFWIQNPIFIFEDNVMLKAKETNRPVSTVRNGSGHESGISNFSVSFMAALTKSVSFLTSLYGTSRVNISQTVTP